MFLFYSDSNIELTRSTINSTPRYRPSDDTYLLLDSLAGYQGKSALEIGVGSGIILRELRKRFSFVIGTDIDFESISFCNQFIEMQTDLVCCDGVTALASIQKFDLIVSNPPYLPLEVNDIYDRTIYGGMNGSELVIEFIKSAINLLNQHGSILILLSSLSDLPQFFMKVKSLGLSRKTIAKKKLFFEFLSVEEIRISSPALP